MGKSFSDGMFICHFNVYLVPSVGKQLEMELKAIAD